MREHFTAFLTCQHDVLKQCIQSYCNYNTKSTIGKTHESSNNKRSIYYTGVFNKSRETNPRKKRKKKKNWIRHYWINNIVPSTCQIIPSELVTTINSSLRPLLEWQDILQYHWTIMDTATQGKKWWKYLVANQRIWITVEKNINTLWIE